MSAILHVVFGPSGAGKSTYALGLARREPAVHFAIDDWNDVAFRRGRLVLFISPKLLKQAFDD